MVVSLRTSASRVVLNNRQILVIVPSRRFCQRYFSNTVFKRDSTSAQQQTQQDSETWSWAKYFKKSKSSIPRHNKQPTGRITSSEQLDQELGPQVYHNGFVERVQYILVLSFLMTMNKEITMADAIRYEKTREPNSLSDDLVRLFEYLKIDNLNSVKSQLTQLFDKLGNGNNDLVTSLVNNFQWNDDQLTKLLNMKNYNLVQDFKFIVTHPSWQVSTLNKINSIFQNATRLHHKGSLFDILQFKTMISLRLIELLVNSNEFLSDKMLFVMLRNFNESGLFHNYSVILYHCLTNDKHLLVPEYLFNELLMYTIQAKKRSEFIKLASLTLNDIPYPKTENSIGREAFNIKIWKLINEKVLNRRNVTTNYVQTFENTYSSDYITDVLEEEEDVNMPIFLKKIQLNKNNLIPPNLSNRSLIANLDFTNCLVANFRNFFYQKLKPCKIRVLKENSSKTGKQKHCDENTVVEDLVVSQGSYHKFDTISMGTAITVLKGCLSFQEFELFDLVIGKIIMDSYFLSYNDKIPRLRIKVTNRIEMDRKFLAINNLNFEHLTQQSGSFVNTDIEKIFNLELLNVYLLRVCTRDTDDHDLQKFNWVKNLIETIYIRPITLKYVTEVNNLFVSDRKTFAMRYNNFFNKADIIKLEIFNHLKRNSEKNAESRPTVNEIEVFDKMKQQRKSVLDATNVDETEKKYNAFDLYVDKDYQIDIATMRNFYRTAKKLKQFDMIEFYENEFFISWESIMEGEETQNYENKGTQTERGSSLRLNIKKLLSL